MRRHRVKAADKAVRVTLILLLSFSVSLIGCSRTDRLIRQLKHEDANVRAEAAEALGVRKDPQAVEPLLAALKDKDPEVRRRAAGALREIGDPQAVEPLLAALKDEDAGVRWEAAVAQWEIKDPRAVEPLLAALKDEEEDVRIEAKRALVNMGAPAVEALLAALKDKDWRVRRGAARALGEIKNVRAVEALRAALKGKDLEVVAGAYGFFLRRGESGTEAVLIKALNEHGDKEMAIGFLNSGNRQLEGAARSWAARHGYQVMQWPAGSLGPRWGR